MGTIRRFFDQNVVVSRLRVVSGNKRAYSSTATVEGHIQSLSPEHRQSLGIIEERAWEAWFDVDTDIKNEDTLTDERGVQYNVREITRRQYGINQHLEVILMEKSA